MNSGGIHCATCRNSYLAAVTPLSGIDNHVLVESITAPREDGKYHHRSNRRRDSKRLASSGLEVSFAKFSNGRQNGRFPCSLPRVILHATPDYRKHAVAGEIWARLDLSGCTSTMRLHVIAIR